LTLILVLAGFLGPHPGWAGDANTLFSTTAGTGPSISTIGNEHVLNLGKAEWEAIKTYCPGFQLHKQGHYMPEVVNSYHFSERQTLFAVIGDFNGDGKKDVVLQGYDKTSDLLIAVVSSAKGPRVIEIKKWTAIDMMKNAVIGLQREDYLTFVPKGKINSPIEKEPLRLSADAFQLVYFEKAGTVYYLSGGKFEQYTTGD